jgi:DNA polymerase III delta subunit
MELSELHNRIVKNKIPHICVFCGPEGAVMNIYLNNIAAKLGVDAVKVDTVADVVQRVNNRSLVTAKALYVVRGDDKFITADTAWDKVRQAVQADYLVLIYGVLDKRTKFYKSFTEELVEFERLSPEVLEKYVQKRISVSESYAGELVEMCGKDYNRIMLECDKIHTFATAQAISDAEAMEILLDRKLIYADPKDAIFNLVDDICQRRAKDAFYDWDNAKAVGENSLAIIKVLYSNLRSMLIVMTAGNGPGICERTGLTSWQVKLAKEKLGAYSEDELIKAINCVRWVERGIKTGGIEERYAIDYILVNLL